MISLLPVLELLLFILLKHYSIWHIKMFPQKNLVSAHGWHEKKQFVRLVALANNSNKQPVFPFMLCINRNVNDKLPPLHPIWGEITESETVLLLWAPVDTAISRSVLALACSLAPCFRCNSYQFNTAKLIVPNFCHCLACKKKLSLEYASL